MAEVVLFHHAQGLTPGVVSFADEIRRSGHTVHTPDLYEGRTFERLEDGIDFARQTGFDVVRGRGVSATEELGDALVYAGFSLGGMPAQQLAQTRSGARGALLYHSCVPVDAFGDRWPGGVPVQVHGIESDPLFTEPDGDLDAARALVSSTEQAELFLYTGEQHLFADASLPSYDEAATRLLTERTLDFLARIDH